VASRFLLDGVWTESGFVDHFDIFDVIPEFVDKERWRALTGMAIVRRYI
jgi:hypothetical protein